MNPKRKKVQDHILSVLSTLDPSGDNKKMYVDKFEKMSDIQFDNYMKSIKEGEENIFIYAPNLKNTITMDSIKNAANQVDLVITDHLWLNDPVTGRKYKTPHKYLILRLPIRRVKQFLLEKMSIPESDSKVDLLSGQVIKPDKGSAISLIEMQTMVNKGLDKSILELIKVRGGDNLAYAEFKSMLEETGVSRLSELSTDTSPRSVVVAEMYLKAMHIDNNLTG
jgi:hypothetical protein